jgi:cytochrome oxidase Cu insertion factor (SCO1/SenC/PrrC family)
MKKFFAVLSLLVLLAFGSYAQTPSTAATPAPTPMPSKFKVGEMAPDFTLTDTAGQKVKLSDFRGKNNVVLAFYVFAFTGG